MMGIAEKLANAENTNWVSEGFSETEVKTMVELAKISARIERCRIDMKMTQEEFAEYMGVTQGMVSKWESREYNFTIRTLNEICQKINLELSVSLETTCDKSDDAIIKRNLDEALMEQNGDELAVLFPDKEAIA